LNKAILNIEIQAFINSNLKEDIPSLLLKGVDFKDVSSQEITAQIEAKNRCEKKLPTWFTTKQIYYPNKLNIEQSSSEVTAKCKANLVSGERCIDLTGGFGVDTFYFSKHFKQVTHCEVDSELHLIASHNFKQLGCHNIECINQNGIEVLKALDQPFDCIYIDPSRRDSTKQKVFLLADCTPNIKTFQGLFLKYAKTVIIKTSPLLDLSATLANLKHVKSIHIIAVNNDVKELLWILERDYDAEATVKTINFYGKTEQHFDFNIQNESEAKATYSQPLTYLYEPNSAILKAGAFKLLCYQLSVFKLHQHSHLYTSDQLTDFPGRRFKTINVIPFNKKAFAKMRITKANVTTRNFPMSVSTIRKKLKISDGGSAYLFFTTNTVNEKIIIQCSKVV